ncbi:transport and Golgi organization protein 2 homolog [Strongylocentrotus purpuratus]|uniref:Ser/Thr-rich protein T10 in DGCR region n=1 Tax=Strongylocentrotus purpuratus TaxID=7668 RepID=A0A7M7P7C5_STRPU|nr:transport and Golgi organization protein 2 homolog [Strongylocentrotus purpuratus]
MCVTAFCINANPSAGGYRFVMIFNRDEFLNRPTKAAHFWTDHPDIVGGVDMNPGKEGGTWLGMSKKGRLAVILNIFNPGGIRDDAKGRGALVSDFLTGEQTTDDYLKKIAEDGEDYNGFNLFTLDISNGDAAYFSNKSGKPPQKLQPGIFGVSNSTLEKPWPKANHLKTNLEEIINSSSDLSSEDLLKKLHSVLESCELLNGEQFKFKPGMTIEEMRAVLPQMVHVWSPVYGTRSSTVITVDAAGEVVYSEKSLEEPIDPSNLKWTTKEHRFHLTCAL